VLSEPRTISLLCEIVHIPIAHTLDPLREIYNRVCSTCGYENFIRTASGARLERPGPDATGFSHLTFSSDRIQFTDDHMGISVEQFAQKVSAALQEAISTLRLPVILAQQTTVRVTTTPNSSRSAEEFLGRRIFRVDPSDLASFARPASMFGFRMMFPQKSDHLNAFNARIESYLRDPQSVYIENVGSFKQPIQCGHPQAMALVERNILETAEFLVEKLLPFLSTYDRRDSE
jgi:hypothetical protein